MHIKRKKKIYILKTQQPISVLVDHCGIFRLETYYKENIVRKESICQSKFAPLTLLL